VQTAVGSPDSLQLPCSFERRNTRCSANRSTARETAAPGTGCSRRWSVTSAGLVPALAVSRLSRATRRSQSSLQQHMFPPQFDQHTARRSRRRTLLRGATVSAVTNEETKTGSERDCRAAHGAARVPACVVESPFFYGVEPGAPNAHTCALGWESERRVRMRRAAWATSSRSMTMGTGFKAGCWVERPSYLVPRDGEPDVTNPSATTFRIQARGSDRKASVCSGHPLKPAKAAGAGPDRRPASVAVAHATLSL